MIWPPEGEKIEDMFIRFDRIHERDGRTYRRTLHGIIIIINRSLSVTLLFL